MTCILKIGRVLEKILIIIEVDMIGQSILLSASLKVEVGVRGE